jgi:hypothetical protein
MPNELYFEIVVEELKSPEMPDKSIDSFSICETAQSVSGSAKPRT